MVTAEDLRDEWVEYFERMIGGAEMNTGESVKARIMNVAATPARGAAAYACWLMIEKDGWQSARENFLDRRGQASKTWYRHIKVFRDAGLSDADISAGNVVPLRRKVLEYRMVNSWAELLNAA